MVKLSQRKMLSEGFGSLLRKGIASAARGAAAAGGALKSASDAGVSASVGGIVKGAKAGYEAEKQRQKGPESELVKVLDDMAFIKIGNERQKGDTYLVKVADLEFDETTGEEKEGRVYNKPLILKWEKDNRAFKVVRNPKGEKSSVKKKVKKTETAVFKPAVGQTVLVRTKKNPAGEPGVVKIINPSGAITVATAGNKAGYAFNPKNVLPDPRIKNENSSQRDLLRQLTLLSS